MAIYLGSNRVKDVYLGNDKVKQIYLGNELVYQSEKWQRVMSGDVIMQTFPEYMYGNTLSGYEWKAGSDSLWVDFKLTPGVPTHVKAYYLDCAMACFFFWFDTIASLETTEGMRTNSSNIPWRYNGRDILTLEGTGLRGYMGASDSGYGLGNAVEIVEIWQKY